MRKYYVSNDVVATLSCGENSLDCYIQSKDGLSIEPLESETQTTDTEVGRHGLAILYKDTVIKGHDFHLNISHTEYGDNGNEFGDGQYFTKEAIESEINTGCVFVYCEGEILDDSVQFYSLDVLSGSNNIKEIVESNSKENTIDIGILQQDILEDRVVLVPVLKENLAHEGVTWVEDSSVTYKFHNKYMPTVYKSIDKVFKDKIEVLSDFLHYNFYAMSQTLGVDSYNNTWVSLRYKYSDVLENVLINGVERELADRKSGNLTEKFGFRTLHPWYRY